MTEGPALYIAKGASSVPDAISPILPDPRSVLWIAGDESGTLNFPLRPFDRYFLVASVTVEDTRLWAGLNALDRELSRTSSRTGKHKPFHANKDGSDVRQRVFELMRQHAAAIHATVLDKDKVPPILRQNRLALYTLMWAAHLVRMLPRYFYPVRKVQLILAELAPFSKTDACQIGVGAASGNAYYSHLLSLLDGSIENLPPENPYDVPAFQWMWANAADSYPLQVADYAAWAMHRKWEGDTRWYEEMEPLIQSETSLQLPDARLVAAITRQPKKRSRVPSRTGGVLRLWKPGPATEVASWTASLTAARTDADRLEEALIAQTARLDAYSQDKPDYLVLADEVIRLGRAILSLRPSSELARTLVVMIAYNQAHKCAQLGKLDVAIDGYGALVDDFLNDPDPGIQRQVARAIVNRSNHLREVDRSDEALAGYQLVLDTFGRRVDRPMSEAIGKALVFSAELLPAVVYRSALQRLHYAVTLIDDYEYDRALRALLGRALLRFGQTALLHGLDDEGIAHLNEIVRLFGASADCHLLVWVAEALTAKAMYLQERNRPADALGLYDMAVSAIENCTDLLVRVRRLRILGTRASFLTHFDWPGASEAINDVIAEGNRIGGADARPSLAVAVIDRAVLEIRRNDSAGATAMLERLLDDYDLGENPVVDDCIGRARTLLISIRGSMPS